MGRRFPSEANPLTHHYPALSISLFIASIAATMAIITTLCGRRSKNPSSSSPKASPAASASATSLESSTENTQQSMPSPLQNSSEKPQEQESSTASTTSKEDFPLHPAPHQPISTNAAPKRNLMVSLSMKLPEALSWTRIKRGKEHRHHKRHASSASSKDENAVPEDSIIWMKTIILGERCRVPTGEDDDDAAIVYDDKGRRVPVYQPRTPRSLPVSRTGSHIDPTALPSRQL